MFLALDTNELVNRKMHTPRPVSIYQRGVNPLYALEPDSPTTESMASFNP